MEITLGQLWISDAESSLGLGIVSAVEHRQIEIYFAVVDEVRIYALATAPLTRIIFAVGDIIENREHLSITITSREELEGLWIYSGVNSDNEPLQLIETSINPQIQLHRPQQRLFNSQLDPLRHFDLRLETLEINYKLRTHSAYGLIGSRTELLPHQLYIADEVSSRYAPRVLLADEVGLGKTIEAGMIIQRQLLTELANRTLIILPEALIYQWLVEMMRRFNLHFSIFDEERCLESESEIASGDVDQRAAEINPFLSRQLIITPLELLLSSPKRCQQIEDAGWDLLVVDEAHHLEWHPDRVSSEYQIIEQLALQIPGTLLLTATPEQLGKEGHFARLRLLDPDRYSNYEHFISEENEYRPIASYIDLINSHQFPAPYPEPNFHLDTREQQLLKLLDHENQSPQQQIEVRQKLINALLDRHGTGRVMFRNRRQAISGFPQRRPHFYPLPQIDAYHSIMSDLSNGPIDSIQHLLNPEALYREKYAHGIPWWKIDPRTGWLLEQLQQRRGEKIVLITHTAETAIELGEMLLQRHAIHAALFHQHMSLVERDRAAIHFADPETGCPLLICSEIGSEGRNFQFAHHLILFDLPFNPDLLEQRIGRLDRIGQRQTIEIHIPYIEDSPQQRLMDWYHQGADLFTHISPAVQTLFSEERNQLSTWLMQYDSTDIDTWQNYLQSCRIRHQSLLQQLEEGRDKLLEYNSFRQGHAQKLLQECQAFESEYRLEGYQERLWDALGVENVDHAPQVQYLRPGLAMGQGSIPGLSDEGMTITTDRKSALIHENYHFLSWEHPLIQNAMEMITSSEMGNSTMAALQHPGLKPGTLLLEAIWLLEAHMPQHESIERYLPPSPVRLLIDIKGRDLSEKIPLSALEGRLQPIKTEMGKQVIEHYRDTIKDMLSQNETLAQQRSTQLRRQAGARVKRTLESEVERLRALQEVNSAVKSSEIEYFEIRCKRANKAIKEAALRLDALRILIAT